MEKICFFGAGKMASAIIKGLLEFEIFDEEDICAVEVNEIAAQTARKKFGITVYKNPQDGVKNSDIVFLSVKPFVVPELLNSLKDDIEDRLVISIAAGVTFAKMESILGRDKRLIRVMPNTPALLGYGMSAVCANNNASAEDAEFVENIFSKIGRVIQCNESDIDAITGVSGSGPAFYYYIIDEIAKAGESLGLDYKTALLLSSQTALGAAAMILDTGSTPEELISAVTTPGGTTEAGNRVLLESSISKILAETVRKTAEKSASLM